MKVSRQQGGDQLNATRRVREPGVGPVERSTGDAAFAIPTDRSDSSIRTEAVQDAEPDLAHERPAVGEPTRALRVLVVEDDALIGFLLGEMLKEMGYDLCAIEATEAGAIEAAMRCKPDLIIMDVLLESGSGVSAIREILRLGPVPFVFATGDLSGRRALISGAVVIQKPFDEAALTAAIRRAVAMA
jgi:CheY-like chemotaxis protein